MELQNTTDIDMERPLSSTQENAKAINKESSFKREEIKTTPFSHIEDEDGVHFIVLGEHRISEHHESKEEAIDYMMTWNFKCNVIAAMIDITNNIKK